MSEDRNTNYGDTRKKGVAPSRLPRTQYSAMDCRDWRPLRAGEIVRRTLPAYVHGVEYIDAHDDNEVVLLCKDNVRPSDLQRTVRAAVSRLQGLSVQTRAGYVVFDDFETGKPRARNAIVVRVITNEHASFYTEAMKNGVTQLADYSECLDRALEADPDLVGRSREYDHALRNHYAEHGSFEGFTRTPPIPYIPPHYEPIEKRPIGRPRTPTEASGECASGKEAVKRGRGRPRKTAPAHEPI